MDLGDLKSDEGNFAEMRCPGTLHGVIRDDGLVERKCHHVTCTKGRAAVFHYFHPLTGELVETKRYKASERKFTNGCSS